MAQVYKRLNSIISNSTPATAQVLYTCATAAAVVSTMSVCNTGSSNVTYRVCVSTANVYPGDINGYIIYDGTVSANDTSFITVGLTLDATNKYLLFSASANTLAVSVFGVEIT